MEREMFNRDNEAEDEPGEPPSDADLWAQMKAEDSARQEVNRSIDEYEARLMEDWNRRKAVRERTGLLLSRFSPASAFRLACMSIAQTDVHLKDRYTDALNAYRTDFLDYVDRKSAESGPTGGVMISMSTESGLQISTTRDNEGLDISDRPMFRAPEQSLAPVVAGAAVDFGILGLGGLILFAGAFVSFLRYDLR
jgi:hypothetical protein